MRPLVWSILLALALGAPARAEDLSSVSSVIDLLVDAYGGASAVKRLEAFRVEAEVASKLQGVTGDARRDYQAPNRLRVEIAYPGVTEVRILNGESAWRGDASRLQRVSGMPKLAMVYQLLRSTVPESVLRHRNALEDRGVLTRSGSDYRVLSLPWSNELNMTFWIHPKTHRVIWVEGTIRAEGGSTAFATRYDDFREVDSVLVPFAEENYASGQHTGNTRLRRVVFSPADLGPFDPTAAPR